MTLSRVVDASEDLVRAVRDLPSADEAAAALALALGRVAALRGVPLERLFAVARVAHGAGDPSAALRPVLHIGVAR